jgi:hypothetical protein
MADCEKLNACPFFSDQLAKMPGTASLMKQTYCRGDSARCARYMVATKGLPVPPDLFPNQRDRALRIIGT